MATVAECKEALDKFAATIAAGGKKIDFNRRLACDISDLNVSFHGRFTDGTLVDITEGPDEGAQIRMTVASDDLVALVNGDLDFGAAFASGRVKIKASILDLLKLKGML